MRIKTVGKDKEVYGVEAVVMREVIEHYRHFLDQIKNYPTVVKTTIQLHDYKIEVSDK
jgi:hypothetical protein